MRRFHFIGRKSSGKTTLIVELVRHLTAQGYRVATVKHTHHDHELDTPGKDSHRHRQAGAAAVGILSSGMNAVFWPQTADRPVADHYDQFSALFADCDLVLVEGHSQAEGHKFEVWRAIGSEQPLAASDDSISALITDEAVEIGVPIWSRGDVPAIASRLLGLAE